MAAGARDVVASASETGTTPSSPRPSRRASASSSAAWAASGPRAMTWTLCPASTSRPMMAITLFAFAWSSPRLSRMSLSYFCARLARTAAGRACRPSGFGRMTACEVTLRPAGEGAPSAAPSRSPSAKVTSATSSAPAVTRPVRGVNDEMRSEFVITICVSRLLALVATLSRSKLMSSSPTRTWSPILTLASKPSPRIFKVSRPMCSSTSRSPRVRMVTACKAGCRLLTSPSHGARR